MRPPAHIIASAATALVVGTMFESPAAGLTSFTAGILIDVDHLFDYVTRKRHYGVRDFLDTTKWGPDGRLWLVFHAWEYLPLIAIVTCIPAISVYAWGLFWGIAVHMTMDQFYNNAHPWAYFILFRMRCGFSSTLFFDRGKSSGEELLLPGNTVLTSWKKSSS